MTGAETAALVEEAGVFFIHPLGYPSVAVAAADANALVPLLAWGGSLHEEESMYVWSLSGTQGLRPFAESVVPLLSTKPSDEWLDAIGCAWLVQPGLG